MRRFIPALICGALLIPIAVHGRTTPVPTPTPESATTLSMSDLEIQEAAHAWLVRSVDHVLRVCDYLDDSAGWPPKSSVPLPTAGSKEACAKMLHALKGRPELVDEVQHEMMRQIEAVTKIMEDMP